MYELMTNPTALGQVPGRRWQALMRLTLSAPLYRWYSRSLMAEVSAKPMPQHVALILDGNRRFARQLGLGDVTEGHRYGAKKVKQLVQWCDELQIPAVTLWGLSTDNLKQQQP